MEYEWYDSGGLIRNYGPNMIYLLFKRTKPATRIGVSNLKDEIEKSALAKFGNNVNKLLDVGNLKLTFRLGSQTLGHMESIE